MLEHMFDDRRMRPWQMWSAPDIQYASHKEAKQSFGQTMNTHAHHHPDPTMNNNDLGLQNTSRMLHTPRWAADQMISLSVLIYLDCCLSLSLLDL